MEHLFLHTLLLLLKWTAIAEDPLHPKLETPADPVHPYAHAFERENTYITPCIQPCYTDLLGKTRVQTCAQTSPW